MDDKVDLGLRQTLVYLILPALAMLISFLITSLVVTANPYLYGITLPTREGLIEEVISMLVIGIVGAIATAATFLAFKRGGELLDRLIIGAFLSPVFFLLCIFLGQSRLLILSFQAGGNIIFSIISLISIFFAMMAIALIISDAMGPGGRNAVFGLYGIILGVFLATFPWFSSLSLIIVLSAADTFFARKLGSIVIHADPRSISRGAFVFVIGDMMIGIGDLVIYSALAAYAVRFFGPIIGVCTIVAVLVGCIINTRLIARNPNRILPGLPLPLLCALVPILFSLYQITLLGLILPAP